MAALAEVRDHLRERGRLEEGFHADVVVFDPDEIGLGETYTKYDLPAGAGRLYADARGVEHVFTNGVEIVRDGEDTGARPGPRILAVPNDLDTVREDVLDAPRIGVEAPGAGRQVVFRVGLAEADLVGIEDDHVRMEALFEAPALTQMITNFREGCHAGILKVSERSRSCMPPHGSKFG